MLNISTTGYKRNSPDKNKSHIIVPSGDITMKDVDFPVLGIDNMGNSKIMQPGQDYTYPGEMVLEFPLRKGGIVRNKKQIYNKIFKK